MPSPQPGCPLNARGWPPPTHRAGSEQTSNERGVPTGGTQPRVFPVLLGCLQLACAHSSAWRCAGQALCPQGLPWKGATDRRLGVHSPLPPASGLLLPCQGPQLVLRRVLVSEETEGKQRPSGKPGHGGGPSGEPQKLRLQSEDWP